MKHREPQREPRLVDLEIDEDGTLRLFCARGTDWYQSTKATSPKVIAGLVLRIIQFAARISDLTGYVGTWELAAGLTGVKGARIVINHFPDGPPYSEDSYKNTAQVDTAKLTQSPLSCVDDLIGRFLRGAGHTGGAVSLFPELIAQDS